MRGLFNRIRFRALKLFYEAFFFVMVRDASWQGPLFSSIAPEPKNRVLNFGPGSTSSARTFALRFPDAEFVAVDPDPKAIKGASRSIITWRHITNLSVIEAPHHGRLPFSANSFDKVVLVLSLHDRPPEEKLGIAKEMLRVLRRGGTLHVADYDRPDASGEGAVLKLARYLSGPTAAHPHIDGSWIDFFAKVGFTGIRKQSSHSVRVGRISLVKARKR